MAGANSPALNHMKNYTLNINEYAKEISEWRIGNGFRTPTSLIGEDNKDAMLGKLMLVVSELAEASEAVRKGDNDNFKEEIADTFIRLMDITCSCSIDIETEILKKMATNRTRPFRHGKQSSL